MAKEEINEDEYEEVREQDRYLPVANIARIMKRALPKNAKIAKEAKETVQECVSEFISFITGEASDKCIQEKRKTLNGDDFLWAMSTLGFEKYLEPLETYLNKYREAVRGDRGPPSGGSRANQDTSEDGGRGMEAMQTPSSSRTAKSAAASTVLRLPKGMKLPPGARMVAIGSPPGQEVRPGARIMMVRPNGSGGFVPVDPRAGQGQGVAQAKATAKTGDAGEMPTPPAGGASGRSG